MKKKTRKPAWQRSKNPRIFSDEEILPRNAKVDVHMRLDADIVEFFRDLANKTGKGYQTLLNEHLRRSVMEEQDLTERVARIEKALGVSLPRSEGS